MTKHMSRPYSTGGRDYFPRCAWHGMGACMGRAGCLSSFLSACPLAPAAAGPHLHPFQGPRGPELRLCPEMRLRPDLGLCQTAAARAGGFFCFCGNGEHTYVCVCVCVCSSSLPTTAAGAAVGISSSSFFIFNTRCMRCRSHAARRVCCCCLVTYYLLPSL